MAKLKLEEIGVLSGVSRSTVSRVINNQLGVRAHVRDRVLKVISETGYYPNPAARSLASNRSYIISLVVPETTQILFTDPYFAALIKGIAEACNKYDYTLSLILFHVLEDEAKLPRRVVSTGLFDAVIVTATQKDDPLVEHLIGNHIPFVLVGSHQNPDVSFVDTDNQTGAYEIVQHLVQLGRQRIATITGPMNNFAGEQRKQGYLNALRAQGLPIDESLIMAGNFSESSGFECMRNLIPLKPDAVFVASDMMAWGAMRALRERGIPVPDEIALAGYDDLPPAMLTNPALTTVSQPVKQLGIRAVETLIDILEKGPEPVRRVILPTRLVIRESCGALLTHVGKG